MVVSAPNEVKLESHAPPDVGPNEVLIEARTTLISPGTERAFYLALPNTNATYPLYPGYSVVGNVAVIGANVETLKVGDRVACAGPHAAHMVMQAAACVPVPDALSDEQAVFFNLSAIAMQGVHKARLELGEAVLIMGAGLIGLFAMQQARLAGGLPVMVADLDDKRLSLARQLGADEVLLAGDSLPASVALLSADQDKGANVVIEATGASPAVIASFQAAAPLGRVVLLGSSRGLTDGVNFYRDVHRKGLHVIGGHEITRPQVDRYPGYWPQRREHDLSLRLMALGRLQTEPLITHRFAWRDFAQAYEHLAGWDNTAMGMVIDWQA